MTTRISLSLSMTLCLVAGSASADFLRPEPRSRADGAVLRGYGLPATRPRASGLGGALRKILPGQDVRRRAAWTRLLARVGGVRAADFTGLLPDSPWSRYVRWRRGLNPDRFDHYHPGLGLLLAEDLRLRNLSAGLPPVTGVPPAVGSGGLVDPITVPPGTSGSPPATPGGSGPEPPVFENPDLPVVPEPSTLALTVLGGAALLLVGRGRAGRTARRA